MVGLRMGKDGYCASGMSGLEKREQLSICLAFRRDELSRFPVVDSVPDRAFDMFMFTHGGKGGRGYSCRTFVGSTPPLTQQAEGFAAYPPQSTKGLHSAAPRRYRSVTKYPVYPLPAWQL